MSTPNSRLVAAELDRLATRPGIVACALVDAATGLIWHASGELPDAERTWEAAIDYWRLYDRQKVHFAGLGMLGAAVMYHTGGVLAVLPCCSDPQVLLVSCSRHRSVDWIGWQREARALGRMIARA